MNTLVIIDVQNDFMLGGNLAVPEGDKIIPLINDLIPQFDLVVATQDWHPANHKSFASQHPNQNVFDTINLNGIPQTLWPDHCVQGSIGAKFHPDLNTNAIEAIFRKGINPEIDSYSGFYDNGKQKSTGLSGFLKEKGATHLHVCGLAADYCVYFSIVDALAEGFKVTLIETATRPINAENFTQQKKELSENQSFSTTISY